MRPFRFAPSALALSLALLAPAAAWADTPPVTLSEAVRQADAVVMATVDDPATDQTVMRLDDAPEFVRVQWRLKVQDVLKGKLAARKLLKVDEALWRQDLLWHRKCQNRKPCDPPEKPAYASDLSRPPRPGQAVLVLLRHTKDGWELAWERGFDLADKAAQAREILRRKP